MECDRSDFGAADLSFLVSSAGLSDRERQIGQRILHRLTSPVRVAVHGPDPKATRAVSSFLQASSEPQTCRAEFVHDGALERIDIVLWCTESFTEAEREIWAGVPDSLKDHSFLIACAPPLERLGDLEEIALEDFIAFHHLATLDAQVELKAICADLTHQIQSGMQAVRDSAHLFVQKHNAKMPNNPHTEATSTPLVYENSQPARAQAASQSDVFETALARFSDHAKALSALGTADPDHIGQQVLELCSAASEDMVEVFATCASDHPDYTALCNVMYEASDMIMLMSLEDNVSAAADAVAILLQIRKDISARRAA